MNLELSNKRALITGSSRGIGLAIARSLQSEGCRVALNGRSVDALSEARRILPDAIVCAGDVTNAREAKDVVRRASEQLGGLDLLICNVGSGRSVPPGEETVEEWHRVFAINLWSTVNSVAAARHHLAQANGAIICISSICGLETIPEAPVTYSVAKAALNAYVQGMARPLGRDGIRINAIAPGNILFDGSSWSRQQAADPARVATMLKSDVPAGRFGSVEEIADAVAFIASPKASFATGAVWVLDGGQSRGGR